MDTRLEQFLKEHGAEWKEAVLPLSRIDIERSLRNQARVSEPLVEETVLLYGCAMEAGSEFPPIVAYQAENGRHVIVDGNHRVAAAEAASIDRLPAVVITNPTPNMIQVMTYEANTKHGLATKLSERIQQALHLEAAGMSRAEAARALQVPAGKLAAAAIQQEADVRIYRVRRGAADKISQISRRRLGAIRSDKVLAAAIDLVLNTKMDTTEVNDLVVAINRARNEDDQLFVVTREATRQSVKSATTAGGRVNLPRSLDQLNTTLAAVLRLEPPKIKDDFSSVGEGMKMIFLAQVADATKRLREIMS